MEIDVHSEMVETFIAHHHYLPKFKGIILKPEIGSTANSLKNLETIGVLPTGVINHQGETLIILKSGDTYYATGLPLKCIELAQYLVDRHEGQWTSDLTELREILSNWPEDLAGPIYLSKGGSFA